MVWVADYDPPTDSWYVTGALARAARGSASTRTLAPVTFLVTVLRMRPCLLSTVQCRYSLLNTDRVNRCSPSAIAFGPIQTVSRHSLIARNDNYHNWMQGAQNISRTAIAPEIS